jgi:hypothetical protein
MISRTSETLLINNKNDDSNDKKVPPSKEQTKKEILNDKLSANEKLIQLNDKFQIVKSKAIETIKAKQKQLEIR